MKWFRYALLNLLRNRRRAFATVLIVAVGTAGILIAGGFALYTYDSLREMAARENGHLILAHVGAFDQEEERPMALGLSAYEEIAKVLAQHGPVRAVLPKIEFTGLISNGDQSSIFVGNGIDPAEFKVKGPFLRVSEGSSLGKLDFIKGDPQIMIGEGLARIMNSKVGDSLTLLSNTVEGSLNAQDVVVQGIFSLGVPEMDKRILFSHLETAQDLLLTDKVSKLSLYLYDTDQTEAFAAQIKTAHPDLSMRTWRDMAFYYVAVRDLYNRIFSLLGIIILGMVFFAISNSLSMSVVERTREIGTLRAIGTQPGEIIRNFIYEGLAIGLIGNLFAVALAGGTALFFSFFDIEMPPPPARSQGYPLIIYIDFKLYLFTTLSVLALCVTAAFFASRRAAKKTIVEALSHV